MTRTEKYRSLRSELKRESDDIVDVLSSTSELLKTLGENIEVIVDDVRFNDSVREVFDGMMGYPLERLKEL